MKRLFFYVILLAFVSFYGHSSNVHAQTLPSFSLPNTAQLTITPQYPEPNQTVNVHLENYAYNLNTLEVVWSLNGVEQKRGIGEKDFQFTVGALGTPSTVSVSTSAFSGSVQVVPTSMDIIWQAQTYTPPFYKGRALYTYQSDVEFIAIPAIVGTNGALMDPKTLVYTWTRNGTVIGAASGYGKNVFKTSSGVLARALTIQVDATTPDNSIKTTRTIELGGISPEIVLYENHPLYGMLYNTALPETFNLSTKEIAVSAVPYFFGVARRDAPTLSYEWKMNGSTIANQANPASLVLRQPEGSGGGDASISLSIQDIQNMIQYAQKTFNITFGTE